MTRQRIWSSIRTGLVVLLIAPVVFIAMGYLSFEVHGLLKSKDAALLTVMVYRAAFYTHIILGLVALLIGPFQFSPGLRNRKTELHRNMGKVYIIACLLSGLAGFAIAQYATGGLNTRLGFTGLAIAWLFTTGKAYYHIRIGDIEAHKRWMFRSFALTFSAVTLRIYLGSMLASGVSFITAYHISAWAAWVPNLIAVELIWIRRFRKRLRAT